MSDLNYLFDIIRQTRQNCLNLLAPFSLDQLNEIPHGFNNNLIWNYGHIIVTQQRLCYNLSGNQPLIGEDLSNKYKKGTKPEGPVSQAEFELLKELSEKCIDQTIKDLDTNIFQNYKAYTTSYGMTLTSIEETITFNSSHEALHLGTMISLKNALNLQKA